MCGTIYNDIYIYIYISGEDFGKYSVRLSSAAPAAQAMRTANYDKNHALARAIGMFCAQGENNHLTALLMCYFCTKKH